MGSLLSPLLLVLSFFGSAVLRSATTVFRKGWLEEIGVWGKPVVILGVTRLAVGRRRGYRESGSRLPAGSRLRQSLGPGGRAALWPPLRRKKRKTQDGLKLHRYNR
jgi:hypothetical protein